MALRPFACLCAALAPLTVLPCFTTARDVSHTGIATVTLSVPYQTVLWDEVIQFTVALRNDSQESLRYIADPYEAAGKQVFITAERAYPGIIKRLQGKSVPDSERVRTIEHDSDWGLVSKEATGLLKPGQSAEWDGTRFDPHLFRIKLGKPKSIQAQVLIGPGKWVSSKPVRIEVMDKDYSSSPVVFEGFYLFSFLGSPKSKEAIRIHRVNIEGKEYLFSSGGARICEVPRGCTPEFASDPETALLTVRFPGSDVPAIRYHYPQMRVVPVQPGALPPKE